MKKLLSLLCCLTVINLCYAQKAVVKGTVLDTLNHVKLSNSVVALLNAKDSILYRFTRTDESGQFKLPDLKAGKYLLMISYPAFADYVEPLMLSDTSAVSLDKLMLTLRSKLLHEVVIQQKVAAIKIKGDTTEFNADSYKTQPNATVEDLLKKLPGIQVDNKGQITAQGQKVKKVLVDGEEFFGDDPTLVTQNLRADMVDKVQLYDKKSDQAAFTGVDDDKQAKTINLKLKDNKKNGYFGKVKVGAGDRGFHDNQALLNMFKGKQKFSAYGFVSNTGKAGLNWNEREKYGESMADMATMDASGDMFISFSQSDDLVNWDGNYSGRGYPLVQTGGLHYNNKWNQDKQNINGNYKLMQLYVDGNSTEAVQDIQPGKIFYRNSKEDFRNNILRNRLNGSYEIQLDSSSSIKVNVDGGLDHKVSGSQFGSNVLAQDSSLINRNGRTATSVTDMGTLNSNLLWRKKLKKKGRTLSLNVSENYSKTTGDGYLNSLTEFFTDNKLDSTQSIDQYKTRNNESININTNLTYTEPLSLASTLLFNYGINITNSHSNRNSFNRGAGGKYNMQDTTYSNDYAFNMLTHRGGVSYNYFKKKLRISLGTNVGLTGYEQQDMFRNQKQRRDFVNWYPQASIRYNFTQQRRLGLSYNGNTQQPSINQLQPLRANEDPLNIVIGNPNLKPSFRNNFWLSYSDYKVITERNLWLSLNYSTETDAIASNTVMTEDGKRTTQAINVNGNQNAGINMNMGWKVKGTEIRVGYNASGNYFRNVSYLNNLQNVTQGTNSSVSLYSGYSKEKKVESWLELQANYTSSQSSIQKSVQTNYWTFSINHDMELYLPWNLRLHSQLNYNIRQKTSVFTTNNNVALWNAYVAKKFGKQDAFEVNFSVNDILNQNIGFSRSATSNNITQSTYSTIGRYGMLSFIWNFNKAGGGAVKN
ncbi:MAG TPA: outer membrane beta-barrel protein [Chitinophaga sp.]|uniref:outer membrane beta-barrel protein n=1 Tax=Chitinophaga sp. TaxID=1869181 RepID=UPI002B6C48EE|nr:outer membrane beta-barrel protein [Chitinophaga sp.]HVI47242.1 outer membrane beta-barrel protein [Chitinophaga sp.]